MIKLRSQVPSNALLKLYKKIGRDWDEKINNGLDASFRVTLKRKDSGYGHGS